MNIKTMMIRTAERIQRLALALGGIGALLPSPAAANRVITATIASLRVADANQQPVKEAP